MSGDGVVPGILIGIVLTLLVALFGVVLDDAYNNSQCIQAGYYGRASTAVHNGLYCSKTTGAGEIVIVPYKGRQP